MKKKFTLQECIRRTVKQVMKEALEERNTKFVPSWALCYIVNNDASGLEPDEIADVDEWVDANRVSTVVPIEDENGEWDEKFMPYPAFGKASDAVKCEIINY